MWPYWLMFLVPAFGALAQPRLRAVNMSARRAFGLNGQWLLVWFVLTLLIGYRFEVGGDWINYLRNLQGMYYVGFGEALTLGDPGYRLLEWLSVQLDWGIYGVNVIGGAIFAFGLVVFCRSLPRPWLALAVAVPYLVTVVAMGYTRQGIAIGVAMLALVALESARCAPSWCWCSWPRRFTSRPCCCCRLRRLRRRGSGSGRPLRSGP
jgi:hypothetical protein